MTPSRRLTRAGPTRLLVPNLSHGRAAQRWSLGRLNREDETAASQVHEYADGA
jgi:hypothetical protein